VTSVILGANGFWLRSILISAIFSSITKHKRYKELSDFDEKNAFDVERYLKHELRLRMDEEFDCYEVDVSEESTA